MKKFRMKIFIISVILFFCTNTFGQKLELDVREHTLDNGIKLLMLEKHDVPIVSLRIVYKVGSVNEHPGITRLVP
jgi:predicted Zn-dependent peptidase